jgi:hypothetical protein
MASWIVIYQNIKIPVSNSLTIHASAPANIGRVKAQAKTINGELERRFI